MPRTIDATLKTWLDTIPLLESHSTFKVSLPFTENSDTFYYATLPVNVGGQVYDRPLKSIGELKLSMGRAADRVEVRLSNEDGLNGGIFIQSRDAVRGSRVEIGRYYRNPQSPTTDYHVILFKGTIVSVSVDDRDIVLTVVSDLYAGGMIGATRVVATSCQFVFKDSATCGYVGAETVCNKRYTDAGGCSGRANQHRYGGALKRDNQAALQTSSGGLPAVNQLVKTWDGATTTNFIQRNAIVFQNATITDDPTNNRTIINPTGVGTIFINLKDSPYSAKGDAKFITDAAITSGTPTLTSATASFTAADVGKKVYVQGAGASGGMLATTISAFVNSTTVTLAANASTTVSGATALYGTDDTTVIQNALTAAANSDTKTLYIPAGKYLVTGLTLTGEVHLLGDGVRQTVICSGANAAILTTAKNAVSFQGPVISNLALRGCVGAGSSQIGLVCNDVEVIFNMRVRDVRIEDCGGFGLHVLKCFASTFEDIYISNCAGYPLVYDAVNMPTNYFRRVDAGLLRASAPVSYRIKAGIFVLESGNTIYNVVDNSIAAIVGRKSGVDGDVTNGSAFAIWNDCNFESYTLGAVHHYYSSRSVFRGSCTFAAQAAIILDAAGVTSSATTITVNSTVGFPASGKGQMELETFSYSSKNSTQFLGVTRGVDGTTAAAHPQFTIVANKQVVPLKYEVDTISSFPALIPRGYIEDTCNFNDGPELRYKDNAAIHCNEIPPIMTMGRGPGASNEQPPIGTYLNTTTSKVEALQRSDGMMKRITVNGTRSFSNQGVRWIEVNNTSGAAMDLTLPPPNLIKTQELMIVKDVAGNAATHAISIYGGGGAVFDGGGGVYTLSENYQAAIFISNEATSPNGSWRLIATHPAPGVLKTTGGGLTGFIPIYTNDKTVTGGPLYELAPGGPLVCKDAIVAEVDNTKDFGGDGFNRFRDIFAARKMKAPEFRTPGGNGLFGGTTDPEGSQVAEIGSIYLRTNGQWYRKATGSGNTGWVQQGSSVTVSGSGLATFFTQFTNDSTIEAAPMYESGGAIISQQSILPETNNAKDAGSASLKWRSGYFGTKVQTVTYEFTNGVTVTTGTGDPEGVVTAITGSLYLRDDAANIYRKTTNTGATGWALVNTTDANTALSNLASVAINASLIANANNTLDLGSNGTRWRTGYFGTSLVTALLALEARTDPGSPANGDAWTSSDRNAVSVRIAGQTEDVVTSMWRNSASFSFDTTTTETSMLSDTGIGTKTLAANRLKVGNQVRVKMAGTYGTKATGPGNFTIKLKNGATTMATISAFALPANVADQNWWIEAVGTVTATGGTGTILWTINFYYNDGTGTLKGRPYTVNSSTIDTTATRLIDVTGQFTVSDVANFWETVTASIEMVS